MKRIIGVVLLLLLGSGGYMAYRNFTGANLAPAFTSLPPAEQNKRRADAQKLVEQIKTIAKDAKSGKAKTFTLSADEAQLNTLLQDRLRAQNLPIENPQFDLSDGKIALVGQGKYNGFKVPVSLTGKPSVKADGSLDFNVESLTLSSLPAPAEWKEKAQTAIADGLGQAFSSGSKVRFKKIDIKDSRMIVSGKMN
jgi:hypothetical protein